MRNPATTGTAAMTLDEYAKRMVQPMVLRDIASGRLDAVLLNADCLEIIFADAELTAAFIKRLKEIHHARDSATAHAAQPASHRSITEN